MSTDNFFSKSNIYPTIWAIIVALLAFGGGLIWTSINGPDEVVIVKRDNEKDTTVTIIKFQPDSQYFEQLHKLTSKSVKTQFSANESKEKQRNINNITTNIAKEYQLKFDSLNIALASQRTIPHVNDKIVSFTTSEPLPNYSKIQRPKFSMPQIVRGYVEGKINSFATIIVNTTEFSRTDKMIIKINFFDKSVLHKITPIFVDIVEKRSTNSVYQIFSEQYEITELENIISLSADFNPGKYIMTIGFYQTDELNTKFPTLYSKKYNIDIK